LIKMYAWENEYTKNLTNLRNKEGFLSLSFYKLIAMLFSITLSSGVVSSAFTFLFLHQYSDSSISTGMIF
jgi:hypothetical protein